MATRKKQEKNRLLKAYNNPEFLNSPPARIIRVMTEMVEPESRFRKYHVWNTVVFFGSSRTIRKKEAQQNLKAIENRMKQSTKKSASMKLRHEAARRSLIMSQYYEDAVRLSEKLTRWFLSLGEKGRNFMICTGGGPGIMEAANRGAEQAGGRSVGLNISLPTEQYPNLYQSREFSFEFLYFFIRKFWFFYLAKALVIFPGGLGTMDEFFELLTLIQTHKSKKYMPVVLYGSEYWNDVINLDNMVKWGTISPEDLNLFRKFDDVDAAFEYLKDELNRHYIDVSVNRQAV